jgi:hypothetical protein
VSTTFAGGSSRSQKATCAKCTRTVHVVVIDGVKIETDTELITVIPFESRPPAKITARRSHAEMCMKYQIDAERAAAKKKRDRASAPLRWIDLATGLAVQLAKR